MAKVKPFKSTDIGDGYTFVCPGCRGHHMIPVPRWTFNGDLNCPTFTPSINQIENPPDDKYYQPDMPTEICHFTITEGKIQFHADCTHDLKGKTIPLPDYEDR